MPTLSMTMVSPGAKEGSTNGTADVGKIANSSPTPTLKGNTERSLFQTFFYIAAVFLSSIMVLWIFIFPSTWLLGYSKSHDDLFDKFIIQPYDGTFVPPATLFKFKGHPAVQFTHILPAGVWALAVPFQLHPKMRKRFPRVHKMTGYVFFTASMLMTLGIGIILMRDLDFFNDYDIDPKEDIDDKTLQIYRLLNNTSMLLLGIWFGFTSISSIYQVAVKRNIMKHQNYIIRHVGSGLGVSLQRVILTLLGPASGPLEMRTRFAILISGCPFATIAIAELYLYILQKKKTSKKHE